jgi:hypothetical protein
LDWITSLTRTQTITRQLNEHPAKMSVRALNAANFLSLLSLLSLLLLIDWRDLDSAVAEDPVHNVVRIPNPKNEGEEYAFQFNGVYDAEVSQQELFDATLSLSLNAANFLSLLSLLSLLLLIDWRDLDSAVAFVQDLPLPPSPNLASQ